MRGGTIFITDALSDHMKQQLGPHLIFDDGKYEEAMRFYQGALVETCH